MSEQASSIPNFWDSLTFGNIEMGATSTGVVHLIDCIIKVKRRKSYE